MPVEIPCPVCGTVSPSSIDSCPKCCEPKPADLAVRMVRKELSRSKLDAIKAMRALVPGLGLAEAKSILDGVELGTKSFPDSYSSLLAVAGDAGYSTSQERLQATATVTQSPDELKDRLQKVERQLDRQESEKRTKEAGNRGCVLFTVCVAIAFTIAITTTTGSMSSNYVGLGFTSLVVGAILFAILSRVLRFFGTNIDTGE